MFLISSTQRCGSTWLTEVVEFMVGTRSRYLNCSELGFKLHGTSEKSAADKLREVMASCDDVKVFKTHDIPSKDFDSTCSAIPDLKIVTISRDFRDVIISRYFYCRYHWSTRRRLGPLSPALTALFEVTSLFPDRASLSCLVRSPILQEWAGQWVAFEGSFSTPNAIRLNYESFLKGPDRAKLEKFTGVMFPSGPSIPEVQAEETANTRRDGNARFVRDGRPEQWREWFGEEQCERIEASLAKHSANPQ